MSDPAHETGFTGETESILDEATRSPEQIAHDLAARIERGLAELHVPPRDARMYGWCNFVPDAVIYCATIDGAENGYEVQARKYQARHLHLQAGGYSPDEPEVPRDFWAPTYRHGFNVVTINGRPFLMDFSFAQFMGPDGYLGHEPSNEWSQEPNSNLLAQQLIAHGFAPLTDETLREYVRITTLNPNPDYLDNVNMALLANVHPLKFEMDDNELMEDPIPPAYTPAT